MRVVIDDNFYVDIDERNYVLKEYRQVENKNGELEDIVRVVGHFVNMEHILERIVLVKKSQLDIETSLDGYLDEHRRISEYVGDKFRNARDFELEGRERSEVPPRYLRENMDF